VTQDGFEASALQEPLDQLMAMLVAGERHGAIDLVRGLRTRGVAPEELITELLVPAQQRVGELWQTGAWNIAQEHAATNIVDSALSDIELHTNVALVQGVVVVACAEGEWHALPARMFAQRLRHRGWSVTFLGGSTPATHLARFLDATAPGAVAISCSIPIFLSGAQRSIEAAHACGCPALVGGAGFGTDDRRSRVLGADGWAATPAAADALLTAWKAQTPEPPQQSFHLRALSLAAVRSDIVDTALELLTARSTAVRNYDQDQLDRTREDLGYILQLIEASILTGDTTVLDHFMQWLETVLTSRGVPRQIVGAGLDALAEATPPDQPEARSLLQAASNQAKRPDPS